MSELELSTDQIPQALGKRQLPVSGVTAYNIVFKLHSAPGPTLVPLPKVP